MKEKEHVASDDAKKNILKGVNKKIRNRNIIIGALSAVIVAVIAFGAVYFLYEDKVPMGSHEYLTLVNGSNKNIDKGDFKGIRAYTKESTINEEYSKPRLYNHIYMNLPLRLLASLEDNWHTHIEENSDGTSSLFFYMSERRIYDSDINNSGSAETEILFTSHLCDTCEEGKAIKPITKIYYLVYDYDNFNKDGFEKVRKDAVLLWDQASEKSEK